MAIRVRCGTNLKSRRRLQTSDAREWILDAAHLVCRGTSLGTAKGGVFIKRWYWGLMIEANLIIIGTNNLNQGSDAVLSQLKL